MTLQNVMLARLFFHKEILADFISPCARTSIKYAALYKQTLTGNRVLIKLSYLITVESFNIKFFYRLKFTALL